MKINKIALAMLLIAGAGITSAAAENSAVEATSTTSTEMATSSETNNTETSEKADQTEQSKDVAPVPDAVKTEPETNETVTPSAQPATPQKEIAETAVPKPSQPETPVAAQIPAAQPAASLPNVSAGSGLFTPEQEERIGQLAKEYLLAHPEVLVEVSEKLDAVQREQQIKKMTTAVIQHQDALLNDKMIPTVGPSDAKVALIEFFDYQCAVCARQAPIIESLMQANPDVRYIFMEWPIFASRWEASLTAAETGLMMWQQKGADAYLAYHNAIFATGHHEGKLTQADIKKAAGKLKGKAETMLDVVARTDTLAQNLGFMGTPGIIVMPVTGASADNVTVFPGGVNQPALEAAISKAAGAAN